MFIMFIMFIVFMFISHIHIHPSNTQNVPILFMFGFISICPFVCPFLYHPIPPSPSFFLVHFLSSSSSFPALSLSPLSFKKSCLICSARTAPREIKESFLKKKGEKVKEKGKKTKVKRGVSNNECKQQL
ncbi:hypothetical protein BCR41DRAFT_233498 [Lobosporangium transversale]|uniref:Uncharacterized protein n=1 Tax=Lobosporangium transversale TaxID=64571 RepID=A0A1Y2GYW2_9FUNG|nr:hypothetical protein BCR41DRAFT_233498 [Lobosporangium transversale]ORZ24776.1 hypothetical protein BCR41DRAFT_233498 [Lobosporangium transversale]|eukprot:XP_021883757.1 hypothetical protein BCR41DRAFT_233498 [Lobosporangium transversale]